MDRQEAIKKLVEHGMSLERATDVTDDAIKTDGPGSLNHFVNFMIENVLPLSTDEYKMGSSRMKEMEKSFNEEWEKQNKRW